MPVAVLRCITLCVLRAEIREPGYDNAGAFFRQVQNDISLDYPKEIVGRHPVHGSIHSSGGKGVSEDAIRGSILALFLDIGFIKARLHGHFLDQILVVVGDSQFFSRHFSYGTSAAAEFLADGDDSMIHVF